MAAVFTSSVKARPANLPRKNSPRLRGLASSG